MSYAPEHQCLFPKCDEPAVENHMCGYHQRVRVADSWHPSEEAEADW